MKEIELLEWFEKSARPFLARHAKDRLAALENDYDRLRRLLAEPDKVTVCFLGSSGIGKSTLLNALAAGASQVLPAGGIGPLTAQATEVHYSATPTFKVIYHPKKHLWKVAFALEQRLVHQQRAAKKAQSKLDSEPTADEQTSDLALELDDEDRVEALADAVHVGDEADASSEGDRLEGLIKQAKQIITGDQFSTKNLPYLVDALRVACDNKPRWKQEIDADDLKRIVRIKQILQQPKNSRTHEHKQTDNPAAFREDLKIHAAGFLSPLIESIEVGWPSDVLKSGVILVDLPGIGIAQDSYRGVTKKYISEQARAVIVVVDRAGPTESTVALLRDSGYWQRLVGAADDPNSDPCSMLMVVTRVDDVAQEEWRNFQAADGETTPKKRDFFARLVGEFKPRMRAQIGDQLGKIGDSSNAAVQSAREQARASILESLEIHPVSAPELRKFLLDDDDDRPFLQNAEQTGIPALQQSLIQLAQTERETRRARLQEVSLRLSSTLMNELRIIDGQWRQEGRAAEEADRLEAALEAILGPKRQEYDRRVGAFREFLEKTVQAKIEALVLEARSVAEVEVNAYLRSLQSANWATLRAAVRRGGIFSGSRIINLPDDISNYFQEPMAAVWGQKLLRDIRKRTSELSSDIEEMVEEICIWANENGGTTVNTKLLENQQQRVSSLAAQMKQVGKEAVDELRETVKVRLIEVIRKPIKTACERFVVEGNDFGAGVKYRILDLFRQLAAKATMAAQQPAVGILQSNFAEVREEIQSAFAQGGDPIQNTADLIVERHEARLKRSDAQKRGPILLELKEVFDKYPVRNDVALTPSAPQNVLEISDVG
ncbi:MAG: dynamin family protein [Burkholderiaceae bacterium]|nr:dynamin family protein [Burkholderiaceae bacterium]